TLVVPREEVDHWIDLDPDLTAHLFNVSQTIGRAQDKALGARRIGMLIVGDEVPHVHVHVVPFDSAGELSFARADPDQRQGSTQRAAYAENSPVVVERAEGHELIDVDGRRYLDAISSLWVNTLGHRVPELDQALRGQVDPGAASTLLRNGH